MSDAVYRDLLANGSKVELAGNIEFGGLLNPLKLDDVANLLKSAEKNTKISGLAITAQDLTSADALLFQTLVSSSDVPLKTFDLSCNLLGPVGVTTLCHALKENISLTKLSLNWTKFGEEGATQVGNLIKLCDTLRVLHISNNQFNAGGAEHIGNGLKVNTSIEELRIDRNNIGDVGAKHIAWSMKVNTTITNLDLSLNRIADEGIKSLCESVALNKLSNLTHLHLRLNKITDLGVAAIAKLLTSSTPLETLNLAFNRFTGLQHIADALTTNKTLKTLILRSNNVGDKVKYLCESLQSNSTLTFLDLANIGLDNSGLKHLGAALAKNSALKSLNIQRNKIGSDGLDAFFGAKGLSSNSTLTYLNLNVNSIGPKGASAVADLLKANASLQTLYLANNALGDKGIESLATGLASNKTLTNLDLHLNEISSVKSLEKSLPAPLAVLNLESNAITDIAPLIAAFKERPLRQVHLGKNGLGDDQVLPLIKSLNDNDKLQFLSLDHNSVSAVVVTAINELLEKNQQLLSIPFHGSAQPIDEKVVRPVLEKLQARTQPLVLF